MKVKLIALGRLKPGPEADLIKDYQRRFNGAAPGLGFGKFEIRELELKKRVDGPQRKALEGALILDEIPAGAYVIALDERGKSETSKSFATFHPGFLDEIHLDRLGIEKDVIFTGLVPQIDLPAFYSLAKLYLK